MPPILPPNECPNDLLRHGVDGIGFEFVDGKLIERTTTAKSSRIACAFALDSANMRIPFNPDGHSHRGSLFNVLPLTRIESGELMITLPQQPVRGGP